MGRLPDISAFLVVHGIPPECAPCSMWLGSKALKSWMTLKLSVKLEEIQIDTFYYTFETTKKRKRKTLCKSLIFGVLFYLHNNNYLLEQFSIRLLLVGSIR
ncbi:hypothetical protein M9H77_14044 [Catharanthus roseus]|uniref:Uncharacterized protein n=1 Tax=Catharanthus roseus TaxID=4058 RepID=A0ACC0BM41_CATRO|nr:hypothetical protein M9H77_14044 [Catharanthus roseus]